MTDVASPTVHVLLISAHQVQAVSTVEISTFTTCTNLAQVSEWCIQLVFSVWTAWLCLIQALLTLRRMSLIAQVDSQPITSVWIPLMRQQAQVASKVTTRTATALVECAQHSPPSFGQSWFFQLWVLLYWFLSESSFSFAGRNRISKERELIV